MINLCSFDFPSFVLEPSPAKITCTAGDSVSKNFAKSQKTSQIGQLSIDTQHCASTTGNISNFRNHASFHPRSQQNPPPLAPKKTNLAEPQFTITRIEQSSHQSKLQSYQDRHAHRVMPAQVTAFTHTSDIIISYGRRADDWGTLRRYRTQHEASSATSSTSYACVSLDERESGRDLGEIHFDRASL